MKTRKKMKVQQEWCVSCGACVKSCPKDAITIPGSIYAWIDKDKCIGCKLCAKNCPADAIEEDLGDA